MTEDPHVHWTQLSKVTAIVMAALAIGIAYGNINGRLQAFEEMQRILSGEVALLRSATADFRNDQVEVQTTLKELGRKIDQLSEDIKPLKAYP